MATMLTFPVHLLTVFSLVSAASCNQCDQWPTSRFVKPFSFEDKCYTWSEDNVTWEEAKSACSDNGGSLVKISTRWIYNALMTNIKNIKQCLWIGANDKEDEGTWKWLDGSKPTFSDWHLSSFHHFEKFDLDCASLCQPVDQWTGWHWSQEKCWSRWQFLCEYGPVKGGQSHINNQRKYRCKEWPSDKYEALGQYGNKCYTRSKEKATWDGAKDSCSNSAGRLVKIPSSDVYTTLISNFRSGERRCYWIGATDKAEEGSWRWTDDAEEISGGAEEIEVATSYLKPSKKVFAQIPCGNSIHLLYKPDMKTSAPEFLLCARKCLALLEHCSVFNYNSVTKECVGFSSADVLKHAKERNKNWDIWKVST